MANINDLISTKEELMGRLKGNNNEIFFKQNEIKDLKVSNEALEAKLVTLNKEIQETCPHDWEHDFIDSLQGYKLSQPIKYCNICKLTDLSVN